MKIQYLDINLRKDKLRKIELANKIIAEYQAQGLKMTLRQLYYQFVARDLLPNTKREYENLGSAISDGRLCGLVDWEALEDVTRFIREHAHWRNAEHILTEDEQVFRINLWDAQPKHVEVWIEKDALIGVIKPVCEEYDVPHFSCRGYASSTSLWEASLRLRRREREGKETIILHLGDHDPSGIYMTRDVQDRLKVFKSTVHVERIALTMEQIKELNPPPNPAKLGDSRAGDYVAKYGYESWELDALSPAYMNDLIKKNIEKHIVQGPWDESQKAQADAKKVLKGVADNYDEVLAYIEDIEARNNDWYGDAPGWEGDDED